MERYNAAAGWVEYVFICCSVTSGEFNPLHLASSAWADAVEQYIKDHPECYHD